jgi:LmbE family N-acetylglucosaminyl deacetylase
MDTLGMTDFEPGFFVDIARYTDLKLRMMRCHKTQLVRGKDGDFGKLEEMMRQQYEARGAQSGVAAAEAFRIHRAFKRARAW